MVVRPQRIAGNIGYDNRFLAIESRPARPRARSNLPSINGLTVFLRKAGSSPVSQSYTVWIQKNNRTQHAPIVLFHLNAQCVQGLRQRALAHDHRQYPLIEQRYCLGALLRPDVRRFFSPGGHPQSSSLSPTITTKLRE